MLNFQRNKSISNMISSGMPNMSTTLNGWEIPLTFIKVIQNVIDGELVTTEQTINFKGVFQPLKDEALELKPEGQRSWRWYWLHVRTGIIELETADKFIYNDKRFKVMEKKDYALNGFTEYQIIQDYEN